MQDQDLNSSQEEFATQIQDEYEQHEDTSTQSESSTAVDDKTERDWRNMRRRQKELERQLEERNQMLEKIMAGMYSQQSQQTASHQVEEDLPDEDYAPVGKVKGIAKKAVQPLEDKLNQLDQFMRSQEQQRRLDNLRRVYPDFDDVVNMDTLELLEEKKPELAKMIAESNDPYKMSLQSYEMIKALGLAGDVPEQRRKKEINKKLEQNKKSVQTPVSYDKRPIAQAYRMTEDHQKALYDEMMRFASMA